MGVSELLGGIPEAFGKVLHLVVLHLYALFFQPLLHGRWRAEMMLAREQALPVHHPVGRNAFIRMGRIHGPAHHTSTGFGTQVGGYGPVSCNPATRNQFGYLKHILKERVPRLSCGICLFFRHMY